MLMVMLMVMVLLASMATLVRARILIEPLCVILGIARRMHIALRFGPESASAS